MLGEQTFMWWTATEWTAIGTMVVAVVALGVGVAEWRRWRRDRRERYARQVESVTFVVEAGASTDPANVYGDPVPGEETRWTFTVHNRSDRTFSGIQILVQYVSSQPLPSDPDIVKMQKEAIGNGYLPDGHNLDLLQVPRIRPGETRTANTLPTKGVRLAWLVIPDQDHYRGRRTYVMLDTNP